MTVPLVPPPVRSVPAVTPAIVPVLIAAQTHELPFHSSTWLTAQVFCRLSDNDPVVPPPVNPLPPAVVTPEIVPAPGNVCPVAKVIRPLLAIERPVSAGVPVPEATSKLSLPEGLAV